MGGPTMNRFILIILFFAGTFSLSGQIIIIPVGLIVAVTVPQHGFLPGKKFKIYPTIEKYDFKGRKIRVELFDDRPGMNLKRVGCSGMEMTGQSEFANPETIYKVEQYIDTLFTQSGIVIDAAATDTLRVHFEAVDARLFGVAYVRVHGLCQMKMEYNNNTKTYCADISDADKNSPIKPTAVVTRKTATRVMASASMREVLEQFLSDLKLHTGQ